MSGVIRLRKSGFGADVVAGVLTLGPNISLGLEADGSAYVDGQAGGGTEPDWTQGYGTYDARYAPLSHSHGYEDLPISASQVSNWDTAYGWGNHATAGYMPKSGGTFTGPILGNGDFSWGYGGASHPAWLQHSATTDAERGGYGIWLVWNAHKSDSTTWVHDRTTLASAYRVGVSHHDQGLAFYSGNSGLGTGTVDTWTRVFHVSPNGAGTFTGSVNAPLLFEDGVSLENKYPSKAATTTISGQWTFRDLRLDVPSYYTAGVMFVRSNTLVDTVPDSEALDGYVLKWDTGAGRPTWGEAHELTPPTVANQIPVSTQPGMWQWQSISAVAGVSSVASADDHVVQVAGTIGSGPEWSGDITVWLDYPILFNELDTRYANVSTTWQRGTNGPVLGTFSGDLNDATGFHAFYAGTGATNRPLSGNGNIIGFGRTDYTTQMGFLAGDGAFLIRQQIAGTWNPWRRIAEQDWALAQFAPSAHTHPVSEVTGLQAALDAKANLSGATFTGFVNVHAPGNIPLTLRNTGAGAQTSIAWEHDVGGGWSIRATSSGDFRFRRDADALWHMTLSTANGTDTIVSLGSGSGTDQGYLSLSWQRNSPVMGQVPAAIYMSGSGGGSFPFDGIGHLVLQPRSSASRSIVFMTGNPPTLAGYIDHTGALYTEGPVSAPAFVEGGSLLENKYPSKAATTSISGQWTFNDIRLNVPTYYQAGVMFVRSNTRVDTVPDSEALDGYVLKWDNGAGRPAWDVANELTPPTQANQIPYSTGANAWEWRSVAIIAGVSSVVSGDDNVIDVAGTLGSGPEWGGDITLSLNYPILYNALDTRYANVSTTWQRGANGPTLQTFGGNLNDATGFHAVYASSSATNRPPGGNANIIGFGLANYTTQLAARDDWFYIRQQEAGVWGPWRLVAVEGGDITLGTVYATHMHKTSARWLKKDIEDLPLEDARKALGLRLRRYRWIDSGALDWGWIADEVDPLFSTPTLDAVYTDMIHAATLRIVQDHEARITAAEQGGQANADRIAALERENAMLRQRLNEMARSN